MARFEKPPDPVFWALNASLDFDRRLAPYDLRQSRAHAAALRDAGVLDDAELEWAALWNPLPKVVFSTTLSDVQGTARLATTGLTDEIERLRNEPGEGDIAIGGATLAADAAASDLIDEYRTMIYPVLVGGGTPYFPHHESRVDLELVEHRTFNSNVVYLRYLVAR